LNHISVYQGVKLFLARNPDSTIRALSLASIPLTRKYLFFVDLLFTETDQWLLSHSKTQKVVVSGWNDYLKARKAMFAHQSQLVWFRHLYIAFSRYMFINHFELLRVKEETK
jgi:N-acetylglucosaminylphosphatidylinositol deacetylase